MRLLEEMREKRQSLSATKDQLKEAEEILRSKKRALFDTEQALEAKRAVKAFSLCELGEGRLRGGGAEGKRNRAQVLDRLARLGQGVSPAQRNDFARFKDAWGRKSSNSTQLVGPPSLQAGRSVCCRRAKKETEPPFLSSCATRPRDALERRSHWCCREAPQLRRQEGACWRGGSCAATLGPQLRPAPGLLTRPAADWIGSGQS